MSFKDFIKLTKEKIILTIIIFIILFFITPKYISGVCLLCEGCPCSPSYWTSYGLYSLKEIEISSLSYFAVNHFIERDWTFLLMLLVTSYILSCLIIYFYNKLKK